MFSKSSFKLFGGRGIEESMVWNRITFMVGSGMLTMQCKRGLKTGSRHKEIL
ncbi:unnamed protein product [Brassica oleracea var. botrytis]|uniref:Uncharacterized protein n=2 Tax=Brassica TaxID=3705 RepID=A0A3P6E5E6_BRAOL|nr:unnamed protein product [Brassica oleracea]